MGRDVYLTLVLENYGLRFSEWSLLFTASPFQSVLVSMCACLRKSLSLRVCTCSIPWVCVWLCVNPCVAECGCVYILVCGQYCCAILVLSG